MNKQHLNYRIIGTGSKGNALYLACGEHKVLIDVGVPYKAIKSLEIDYVLLTHSHRDHLNEATVKRLAYENPSIKFFCTKYLVQTLIRCGVDVSNIYFKPHIEVGSLTLNRFNLIHDVPNCGWKLKFKDGKQKLKVFYATDTVSLDHVSAKDFDYYFVEANYDEDEIVQSIKDKVENGEYSYERRVVDTHLSKQKADKWLSNNIGDNSVYVYIHEHSDAHGRKEVTEDERSSTNRQTY